MFERIVQFVINGTNMINTDNVAALFVLVVILAALADQAWKRRPGIRSSSIRAGAGAFSLYMLLMISSFGQFEAGFLLSILWRGLLAGALVMGAASVAFAVVLILLQEPLCWVRSEVNAAIQSARRKKENRRRQREEQDRARAAAERERALAPAREEARRQAEAAQLRRFELEELRRQLRFECELGYNRLRPAVVQMFPRKVFARLVDDALLAHTQAQLERSVQDLMETVQAVVGEKSGGVNSLMDIADNFDQRRLAVERSSFTAERKDDLIKYLNIQEETEIRKVLER